MKHWKNRILQIKFGRLVKYLAILSICAVLLGGILSVILLQPQISQITSAVQRADKMGDSRRNISMAGAVELLITRPDDFSFPSGHTGASFATVSALYTSKNRL